MDKNCLDCNRSKYDAFFWCQRCNSKRFQHDFDKWSSKNKYIDKFIQETQLNARKNSEVIEWIPYNKLRNIKYLTKGGFSIIYNAIWLGGNIRYWDSEAQKWNGHTEFLSNAKR
jgi:hypothetical protein